MTCHFPDLPAAAPQTRVDGWSPQRQRLFLETLAATGVIRAACDAAAISERSAYALRIRRDGAAFRLGWDAAILIARARLADELLSRAILGQEEVMTRDPDGTEMRRHRHDNRLAMSMLARLDRMADSPAEGTDAALARVVAQDFVAYCDMLCPPADAAVATDPSGADAAAAPAPAATLTHAPDDAGHDGPAADGVTPPGADHGPVATALSPGASAALFLAARMALGAVAPPRLAGGEERCELREPLVDLWSLPPDEAAARLRGIWYDETLACWRTDYPAPPGFTGDATAPCYDIDDYERDLTPQEQAAFDAQQEAIRRPYEDAAARARDDFFAMPGDLAA